MSSRVPDDVAKALQAHLDAIDRVIDDKVTDDDVEARLHRLTERVHPRAMASAHDSSPLLEHLPRSSQAHGDTADVIPLSSRPANPAQGERQRISAIVRGDAGAAPAASHSERRRATHAEERVSDVGTLARSRPSILRGLSGGGNSRSLHTGGPSQPPVASWEPAYRRYVILSDILVALCVALVFGGLLIVGGEQLFKDLTIGALSVMLVIVSLASNRAWALVALGQGAEEYVRVGRGMFAAGVALGLAGLATGVQSVRPWVFLVIPSIALVTLLFRYLLRQVLHRHRYHGECLLPVMAAGSVDTVRDLISRTQAASHIGWRVAAVCTTDGTGTTRDDVDGISVVGKLDEVAEHVRRGGYRIVAVTADSYWTPRRLQQLAWRLEGSGAEMVVAPTLMEVAGPRLHVSGVLGMPLLRVSAPVFTGMRKVIKGSFDRIGAFLLILVALPVMILAALAVMIDSRGSAFYTQRRVGKSGREFTIVKFRTMVRDADRKKAELAAANEGAGVLFKMRKDPRITRVGAILRRYSIDELPQLFNVLTGAMSLVGPRPPLPEESARYEPDMRRRLLVKPGLTGLWQVSGRSDLPWEEAVRLDLRYVEDWSLALDAMILWKTFTNALRQGRAY